MKYIYSITLLIVFAAHAFCQHSGSNADSVLAWLKNGNNEFVNGKFNLHGVDPSLREELSKGQHPKAIILACSDSRVVPELIFNKGLGDLFVIRVAGNIADDDILQASNMQLTFTCTAGSGDRPYQLRRCGGCGRRFAGPVEQNR